MRLHVTIGDAELIALSDATGTAVDPAWPFPDGPLSAFAAAPQWLGSDGKLRPDLGCFLLKRAGRATLVDLGIGPGPVAYLGGVSGRLVAGLEAEGVSPAEVELIVFTHAHFDHVGWACHGDGSPRFPNADYVMPDREWAFWTSPETERLDHHRMAFAANVVPLERAGRLRLMAMDAALAEGLAYRPLPGHTPGHCGVSIGNGAALIAGDVLHTPVQIGEPSLCHRADHDSALARATRLALLADLADRGTILACGHFPPGSDIGHVERNGAGYRWRPIGAD